MATYTYHCSACEHITDVFYKLTEHRPDIQSCEACHEIAHYKIAAPMVLKASYLDGQRSKSWKDVREASKLNLAAAGTDNLKEKAEINKEVKKIGYNFTKDGV